MITHVLRYMNRKIWTPQHCTYLKTCADKTKYHPFRKLVLFFIIRVNLQKLCGFEQYHVKQHEFIGMNLLVGAPEFNK